MLPNRHTIYLLFLLCNMINKNIMVCRCYSKAIITWNYLICFQLPQRDCKQNCIALISNIAWTVMYSHIKTLYQMICLPNHCCISCNVFSIMHIFIWAKHFDVYYHILHWNGGNGYSTNQGKSVTNPAYWWVCIISCVWGLICSFIRIVGIPC